MKPVSAQRVCSSVSPPRSSKCCKARRVYKGAAFQSCCAIAHSAATTTGPRLSPDALNSGARASTTPNRARAGHRPYDRAVVRCLKRTPRLGNLAPGNYLAGHPLRGLHRSCRDAALCHLREGRAGLAPLVHVSEERARPSAHPGVHLRRGPRPARSWPGVTIVVLVVVGGVGGG